MWVKGSGEGCAREEKKMETESEVDGQHQADLTENGLPGKEIEDRGAGKRQIRNIDFT